MSFCIQLFQFAFTCDNGFQTLVHSADAFIIYLFVNCLDEVSGYKIPVIKSHCLEYFFVLTYMKTFNCFLIPV